MTSCSPSATVPLPGGRPAPSGPRTSMFQPAIFSWVAAVPKPNGLCAAGLVWARAGRARAMTNRAARLLSDLDIFDLAVGLHPPGMDGVLVIDRIEAAHRSQGFDGRLHIAALVHGRSEEHTSELQSLMRISYAVFCLKKNKHTHI